VSLVSLVSFVSLASHVSRDSIRWLVSLGCASVARAGLDSGDGR